ncbi:hypothetical protein L596_012688 [Steinernema carpocapsae]|uniref:DH domain-containing protein n=1 Tax=Steinernema carpocapsae TaxID=34508 RepID=A0A4U5NYM3_STECR|nr:hypothetical protein L596_012688 [Steinernema carpocapsae]
MDTGNLAGSSSTRTFREAKPLPRGDDGDPGREDMSMLSRKPAMKKFVTKICVVGEELRRDVQLMDLLKLRFRLEVIYEDPLNTSYSEHTLDQDLVFLVNDFNSQEFENLKSVQAKILGPPYVRTMAERGKENLPFPRQNRPQYCLSMQDFRICFDDHEEMRRDRVKLADLVRYMGGQAKDKIREKEYVISKRNDGDLYRCAEQYKRPVLKPKWVEACWERRNDISFSVTKPSFMDVYRVAPFENLKLYFDFASSDLGEMKEKTLRHKGEVVYTTANATHIIVEKFTERIGHGIPNVWRVTSVWFWKSVDQGYRMNELKFQRKRPSDGRLTPGKEEKQSRHNYSNDRDLSSENLENSNASVLSGYSSDDLDKPSSSKPADKRRQICLELLETEENYVKALEIIVERFKKPLEERNAESEILTKSEMTQIFSKVPPLIQVHSKIKETLENQIRTKWRKDNLVGKVWADFKLDLEKVYPPFINSYDQAKEMMDECDRMKPKFHNFLKAVQSEPGCLRNTLQDLLIRPVQRLGSVVMLLKEILKRTSKSNRDHDYLIHAIANVENVLKKSNEQRKNTDNYAHLLELFNEIDDLPTFGSSQWELLNQVEMNVVAAGGSWSFMKGKTVRLSLLSQFLLVTKVRHGFANTSTANLNATHSRRSLSLSRSISFSHKRKKKLKYMMHILPYSFRTVEKVTVRAAMGTYVLTCRDGINGDEPIILQPTHDYSIESVDELFKGCCDLIRTLQGRTISVEEINEQKLEEMQSSETYRLLIKIVGNHQWNHMGSPGMDQNRPPGGTLKRSTTLSKFGSSLQRSISRISMFSSRSTLPSINEDVRPRPF